MQHMSRGDNAAGEEKKLPEDSGAYSTHLHEIITSDMPHSIELCRDKVRIGSSNLDACPCFSYGVQINVLWSTLDPHFVFTVHRANRVEPNEMKTLLRAV